VRRYVIDGDRWINERLGFLRGLLDENDLPEDQRTVVEAEIASLSKEKPIHHGGPRHVWVVRRWLRRYQGRAGP
jgi:hypothetical protein